MDLKEPDLSGTYTYADYLTWTWDEMTELIHGKIVKMSPAPGSEHQRISASLSALIWHYLQKKKCQVFSAPFDVRLPSSGDKNDENIFTVVQPDISVICDPEKIDARGCVGPPDWVIEILSKHTSSKDLNTKFDIYEESGVKEYWIINPEDQTLLVYTFGADKKYHKPPKKLIRSDSASPIVLPGLNISLEQIFSQ